MTDSDAAVHAHPAWTIGAAPGPVLTVLEHGATVHRLEVTGGDGTRRNVVLGHATPQDYLDAGLFIGGTIGRYANRIAGGAFELDGRAVQVGTSDRGNHLHGGPDGFDRRPWTLVEHGDGRLVLRITSPDGDQGFPGEVTATVTFEVDATSVRQTFEATTDAPTVVNLTSHAYLNLAGDGSGTVDGHRLRVAASRFTPVDETGIPLGDHEPVDGTPFDLREGPALGPVVRADHPQVRLGPGLDHNLVLDGEGWREVAWLDEPTTRTRMVLSTDQPGLQVYTGNFLDGTRRSREGVAYRQGDGLALEPQLAPDTPRRSGPGWPSAVLRPGETYRAQLAWRFELLEG
ncbi:aldose epimerase family protein [Nocardioides litoris]|uniref:aldose epimerase family protein n=1 Tax=Nocardioides litoris TaxID=1926648 RepID=UPI0014774EA3|nr:aldose epimerase family protein [Nocardioides litoris]